MGDGGETKMQTEIDGKLLEEVRRIAEEQKRSEREVMEDALRYFLASRAFFEGAAARRENDSERRRVGTMKEFFVEIERWQRERGVEPLSDEEAMEFAVEELHAMRRERKAGR
ncbi:MAG: hypothetical protein M3494_11890 [Actinomycetota bacterium]|nr:hypothetical protein [Rubrobacter sp.]MDQ3508697.1 hypothetical protein [Actinomycetota bacterium]